MKRCKPTPDEPAWFMPFPAETWKHYKRRVHGEILRRKAAPETDHKQLHEGTAWVCQPLR
jgi:hypothetical protein